MSPPKFVSSLAPDCLNRCPALGVGWAELGSCNWVGCLGFCWKWGALCAVQECAARGEDYERVKLLEISAEDAERWERKKKKKNPDLGFSGNGSTPQLCS